jgi:MarR family transcriptional regulator, organic hydroperoxide resistance regulator
MMVELVFSSISFPEVAAGFELSPPQAHLLRLLGDGAEIPMSAMAGHLHCDASNVTGIVDRLEGRGLVARHADAQDRRIKRLRLTPAGEQLRTDFMARLLETPPAIAALSAAEKRALRNALRAASAPGEPSRGPGRRP